MAFPTLTYPPANGQTINTLPPAGPATAANALAVGLATDQLPLLAQDASIQALITKLGQQRVETLWTDDTNAFFVRVDNAGTISWTNTSGAASSAPGTGARPAAGTSAIVDKSSYQATAAGTGYAVGDLVDHLLTTDPSSGAIIGNFWFNLTQATVIAAPAAANITPLSPLPTGAASQATLAAILAAVATAANQATEITSLATIAANTTPPGLGSMAAVPAGSTNGTALTLPAGAKGARFYLGANDSVTFTIATAAPSSAPANTFTISGASTGSGPNWDENLSGGAAIYITAITGAPKYRAY